uniref:Protein tyrosine phosphatase non-receptor type 3 n=1 Tax=Salarias fasciatus TaxID=181472 RepID=A0A672GAR3_SALFA
MSTNYMYLHGEKTVDRRHYSVFGLVFLIHQEYIGVIFSSSFTLALTEQCVSISKAERVECCSVSVKFLLSRPAGIFTFLQIRSDIKEGRLQCPLSAAVVLASYDVQWGSLSVRLPGYLSNATSSLNRYEDFLSKVEDLHPQHKRSSVFLNTARTLELYGVELMQTCPSYGGLASSGVAIFCNMICSSFFPWGNIIKISFKRKRFFIHLKRKHCPYFCPAPRPVKNLWRSCIDHTHSFFCSTEPRSPRVRHGIRKPRPSSVELTNDLKDMSEGEDVFYTYRASVSSSKDSEGDVSPQQFVPEALFNGKFGFNVKGGVDQKMPLAISHAGRCEPKLLEGDLVVLINGRDISEHTHDQVVMFIRASRESHSRELVLLIRRKGPVRAAPLLQLPPALTLTIQSQEDKPQSPGRSEQVTTLEESMRQLERQIQSGTLCFHFENLYRRKPGLSLGCARLPENMDKNRYKDVLPYDATRVVLQSQEDYINASHMTPPVSGVRLRYVAAQGPLPQTCTQFWQAVWEQKTHTIIMLTTLTERGRTKCHQYWPHPPEVKDYGCMRVKCHSEECNLAYVMRHFTLTHTKLAEERAVTHLQYVAWPDHGVPDDPSDFLLFISSVRERRKDEEPLMVHCSAGIGRTGVLITMETALTLLDEGRPVFPLDIVKTMRDQRPMMVQTTMKPFLFFFTPRYQHVRGGWYLCSF